MSAIVNYLRRNPVQNPPSVARPAVAPASQAAESPVVAGTALFKTILLGDSDSNKSQFITTFIGKGEGTDSYLAVGVDFKLKTAEVNNEKVKFQIWDTAGQERFRSIARNYYNNSKGAFVLYNVKSISSFNATKAFLKEVQKTSPQTAVILVGENSELAQGAAREVTHEQGTQLAQQYDVLFLECSAKDEGSVSNAFTRLVTYQREPERLIRHGLAKAVAKVAPLHLVEMEFMHNDTANIVGEYLNVGN